MNLDDTLNNVKWLTTNRKYLMGIFPNRWTKATELNILAVAFKLKVLGIDWRSKEDFGETMVELEKQGIFVRNGISIKRGTLQ